MKSFPRLLGAVCTLLLPQVATAADAVPSVLAAKPLWEIGISGIGAYIYDYPGSRHNSANNVVLPFAIYRGQIFSADQEGLRGKLAKTRRLEFNLSVDAGFSTNSKNNEDRRGLPNLDYTVEVGPSLEYKLGIWPGRVLTAVAQGRAVFAVNTDRFDYIGLALEPQLIYEQINFLHPGLALRVGLGPKFGYDGFNDYYYDVAPIYATPTRPAYAARSGYQFTALSTRLFYPVNQRLSVFVANQLLVGQGAANEGSPLYKRDFNYAVGAGLAYSLFISKRTTLSN